MSRGPEIARERREIFYSGNVQGVGFRYTTMNVSSNFDVKGYVKNLSDGRVEVLAEGETEVIDRFLESLEVRMKGYIEGKEVKVSPELKEFTAFEVRA
ncbi:Acylphosphatase [Planctomycetales bacterium 10988]|nr:Acylphosphatase [Planctomycetales bacterium 10988]